MASCLLGGKPCFLSSPYKGMEVNHVGEKPGLRLSLSRGSVGMREVVLVSLEPPLASGLHVLAWDFCVSVR